MDVGTHEDAPCALRLAGADHGTWCHGTKFLRLFEGWSAGVYCDPGQHNALLGVRIGEAQHPGPSAWGSYVTKRKRKLKQQGQQAPSNAQAAQGFPALFGPAAQQQMMGMLKKMMEAMMHNMMESFFKANGQWASGATTQDLPAKGKGKNGNAKGGGGGSGEPPAAGPSSGSGIAEPIDTKSAKGKAKGGASSAGDDVGKAGSGKGNNAGSVADQSAKGGEGKLNVKGGKDANGKGKNAGGQMAPAGAPGSKGKGKGKIDGKSDSREWKQDGGWETIEWLAKPSAFGAGRLVTTIAALEDALAQEAKFVAQFKDADFEEAAAMMEGGCPKGSILIKDGEACAALDALQKQWPVVKKHVPGSVNGSMRLRCVWVCTFGADAASLTPAVGFVKAAAPKSRRHHESVVVRCCAWQSFADGKEFTQLLKRPGQFARSWFAKVAPLNIQEFIDSWGWQAYGESQVRGLVRLTKEAAMVALRCSGCWALGAALFFTPLDWSAVDASEAPSLLWVDRQDGELVKPYLERVRKETDAYGLHCGGDRLAVRLDPLDARIMPQRGTWHLRGAKPDWFPEDLEAVLLSVGFSELTIEAKLLRRGLPVWEFRAVRADFRDFVPIELEPGEDLAAEGGENLVMEASRLSRRRKQGEARSLPAERVARFGAINVEEIVKQVAAPKRKPKLDKVRAQPAVEQTSPVEDMVVDNVEADAEIEVGHKRRLPDQGGRDDDAGGDGAKPAAKRSSNCVTLPVGAVALPNPGGGDCLFHCLADVLSGMQKKTRGHRQLRAGIVAWMERHTGLLEQHWDHLGPDGEYMDGEFKDYLKAVRCTGAWAGWLELYAAGVAENINILILTPDGVVKFSARNEIGHFAVFKFELGHYEVVSMDQKTIASLWLSASEGKPSGGRGGGRSEPSSLHLSRFAESAAPSSLHLSGGAVTGAVSAGAGTGLNLSAFASANEGGRGSAGSSKKRSWPTAADLRSLTSGPAERPGVLPPRRRLRRKTHHWLSLAALAKEDGAEPEDGVPAPPSPAGSVAASSEQMPVVRKSKYRCGGKARWPCPLCPLVVEADTVSSMCKQRYNHCQRFHEGQGLPGARRVDFAAFRLLGAEEPGDWRCPLCNWGLPKGTRGSISDKAFAAAKEHHRAAQHRISKQEFQAKITARGARKPLHVMRARVSRLNAGVAKRKKAGLASIPGWTNFNWPFIAKRMVKDSGAVKQAGRRCLAVRQAWSCVRCGFCTRVAACRKSHLKRCRDWDRSKLQGSRRRLWAAYEEAKNLDHGFEPAVLFRTFANADLAMGGAGQPS